jgi:glycerophosphoryl diester phosphodiesterase
MPTLFTSRPHPLVVAHRGASRVAPENTLAAFREALERGADAIELDVQRTSDGHLIILHDATLERTTDGQGQMAHHSLAALKKLDAGRWFDERFAGERLPTLEEAAATIDKRAGLFVEIKQGPVFDEGIETAIAGVIRESGLVEWCEVSSFDHSSVRRMKTLLPAVPGGILYDAMLIDPFAAARLAQADALHPGWPMVTPDLVKEAHRRGLAVAVWTVNEEDAIAQLADMGIDAFVTDVPDVARRVLSR